MQQKFSRYIFPATLALSAIAIWAILSFQYPDFLIKTESRSLFLSSDLYFHDRMLTVGGLLTYISCFLTLFLQFPKIGALTAVIIWCCVTLYTRKTFRLEGGASALAFLPAAMMIAADMQSGYMVFAYRTNGWFFLPAVAYLTTLAAINIHNRITEDRHKLLFLTIWTAAAYPISGFYALLGTAAMAVQSLAKPSAASITRAAAAAVAIAAFPLLWCNYVYCTLRLSAAHIALLPPIFDVAEYHPLWIPYILLGIITLVLSFICSPCSDRPVRFPDTGTFIAGTVISLFAIWIFWYKDPALVNDLRMDTAIEKHDWKDVVRILDNDTRRFAAHNSRTYRKRTQKLASASSAAINGIVDDYEYKFHVPTRTMVLYKDLALLRLGTSGSQAFCHAEGDYIPPSYATITLAIQCGKQLYYNYGIPNFCYRWCIEDAVEYGWSVETLKYAIRCTVIAEDWNIADKYITQLEQSPFHRKWAREQRKFLHHPELIKEAEDYRDVLPLMRGSSEIGVDESKIETFIMQHFRKYNQSPTAEECDASMLWTLRAQDSNEFWPQLANWTAANPGKALPKHYQEAAYMFGNLQGRPTQDLGISPEVIRDFDRFMKFNSTHPVRNIKESQYIYGKDFGDTYYYYYFLMRDLKTH